jgi:hypothetical protein
VAVLLSGPIGLLAFVAALVGGSTLAGAVGTAFIVQLAFVVVLLLAAGLLRPARSAPPLGTRDRPVRRPSGRGVAQDARDVAQGWGPPPRWDMLAPAVLPADAPRVAVLCTQDSATLEQARRLAEAGQEVHLSDSADAVFGALADAPQDWSAAVVDLRAGDDEDLASALADLRARAPDLPVVALGAARDAEGPWDIGVPHPVLWIALRRALQTALAGRGANE